MMPNIESASSDHKAERKYALHGLRFGRYGFLYFTGAFFTVSLIGHWFFGWIAYLQLVWQVAGLAFDREKGKAIIDKLDKEFQRHA